MSPQRIQRRRVKGWRMPAGAVYVGRGAKWGNPFRIEPGWDVFPFTVRDSGTLNLLMGKHKTKAAAAQHAVYCFKVQTMEAGGAYEYDSDTLAELREKLAGKDLACWCPLEQPCHADVLLELANSENVKNLHNQECAQ